MFGVGHLAELIIVLVIALMFFGPKRLPEIAAGLGKSITEFRKATSHDEETVAPVTSTALPPAQAPATTLRETAPGATAAAGAPVNRETPPTV